MNYFETRRYRPSNSTEGEMFEARFCDLCLRDRPVRQEDPDYERGCRIHSAALGGGTPEWVMDADDKEYRTMRCTAYVPDGDAFADAARRFVARETERALAKLW